MKRSFLASMLLILCTSFVYASKFENGNGKLVVKNYNVEEYNAINLRWTYKIVINNTTDISPLRDTSFTEGPKIFNWKQADQSGISIKVDEKLIPYIVKLKEFIRN